MTAYRRVDDLYSPAGRLQVYQGQFRAQCSVTSIESLCFFSTGDYIIALSFSIMH